MLILTSVHSTIISSEFPFLRGWLISLVIGIGIASIFLIFNRKGKRIIRTRNLRSTCEFEKCAVCFHFRSRTLLQYLSCLFKPQYYRYLPLHPYLSILGFLNGLTWIYLLSSELVGVLEALGVILGISHSILGVTVFSFGNTIGDFATNVMLARMGYQSMAIGASWGAPIMSMHIFSVESRTYFLDLLVTLGAVLVFVQPAASEPVLVTFSPIFLSCILVLITALMCNLLVLGVMHKFQLRKSFGGLLISMWATVIIVVIALEYFGLGDLQLAA